MPMDIEEFRRHGYQAIDRICDFFKEREKMSVLPDVQPGWLSKLVPPCPPEQGEDFQNIADDFQKLIIPGLMQWQHPLFFGFFPAANTLPAILGDLYSASVVNPGFSWFVSPAATELESIVMDWMVKLLGLSPRFLNSSGMGGGCIQTSASESLLVSMVAARSRYLRRHPDVNLEDLCIYVTTQTHSIGLKGGMVLGLPVRVLPVTEEDGYSLRASTLRGALKQDLANGRHPFIFVATIGTTSSGVMDNLPAIRDVCMDTPDLWVHVDAAWAGSALACPEYRKEMHLSTVNDIATSFCFSPHKWGLINLDASTLFVRDRQLLIEALDITIPILRTAQRDAGKVVDYKDWHIGLGRKFRSLKFWFVLRNYGVEGWREHIRGFVKLGDYFAHRISKEPLFSIFAPPSLGLTVFRIQPNIGDIASHNALNKRFYDRLLCRKDIFLSTTSMNGITCLRFVVCSADTTEDHIDEAVKILKLEAEAALEEWHLDQDAC
ncbi:pyridoxal phosphate-dependent transferase [Flagelloscypha sp. PMI_526]|nr:pyridoxal phosphate-dependent transferase [Flagelloscypha sp. PMI_526]